MSAEKEKKKLIRVKRRVRVSDEDDPEMTKNVKAIAGLQVLQLRPGAVRLNSRNYTVSAKTALSIISIPPSK